MEARVLATQLAYGRLALGAGLVAAPRLFVGLWLGGDAARGGGHVAAVGLGARDVALGAGLAQALHGGGDARPWLIAGVVADAADCAATFAARRSLPALGAVGVTALAAAGAAAGAYVLRGLRQPTP